VPNVRLPAGSHSSGTCSIARAPANRESPNSEAASVASRPACSGCPWPAGTGARTDVSTKIMPPSAITRPSSVSAGSRSPVANEIDAATAPSSAPMPATSGTGPSRTAR